MSKHSNNSGSNTYTKTESVELKAYFSNQVLEYIWDKTSNSPTPYPIDRYDAGRCSLILSL